MFKWILTKHSWELEDMLNMKNAVEFPFYNFALSRLKTAHIEFEF